MSIHRANHSAPHSGRFPITALAATIAAVCVIAAPARAAFDITTGMGNTGQDFDTLISTGTNQTWTNDSTLVGWSLFNSALSPISSYNSGTGSSSTGNFYSFGTTGSTDRALGGVGSQNAYFGSPPSGEIAGYIAFAATNNSGTNLASFTTLFDGEQWRNGGNTSAQTMVFEYGIGATFDTVSSWIAPGGAFNWTSPVVGTPGAAVDGNTAGLVSGVGGMANGLAWGNGETLWVRWVERNDFGGDHGLAIDNFTFAWQSGPPPKKLTWAASNGIWDTTEVNWLDEVPAPSMFSTGDSVSFTDSGLTQSTVDVAAGGVIAGQVTVSHTSGTYTFTGGPITSSQALQKTGAGALILGASFSAGLNATEGSVQTSANEVLGNSSGVTLGSGVPLDLANHDETIGSLNLTENTITTGTGLLTVNGNVTINFSPNDTTTTISGRYSSGAASRTFNLVGGNTVLDLDLAANVEGAGRVSFSGFGKVRIGGDNSAFTGGFRLNNGITYLLDTTKPFGSGPLFLNGGILDAQFALTGANKLPAVSLGGVVQFAGEDFEFGGAVTFFDTVFKALYLEAGQTLTFSGSLAGSNTTLISADFNKSGPGTLVLREDGSGYSGAIKVDEGTLIAETVGALGSGNVDVTPFLGTSQLIIQASQTLASLTIGAGGTVVLTAPPPPTALVAVPEPGSAVLLLGGVIGLLGRRRMRAR